MKRIHIFEFEDYPWFPNWIRKYMTRLIIVVHKFMNTSEILADLIAKVIKQTGDKDIIDLCSGSGGPMIEVAEILKTKYDFHNLKLELTDLYPNTEVAEQINTDDNPDISYNLTPVNATQISKQKKGLRTMICSLHHMKPAVARNILNDAKTNGQAICIYEISDNSPPIIFNFIFLPVTFIFCFIVTLFSKPKSIGQLFFTFIIPIIPIFYAWDGAMSNARTYTLSDMDELLEGLHSDDYKWEKGAIKGKGGNKLYLLGIPQK